MDMMWCKWNLPKHEYGLTADSELNVQSTVWTQLYRAIARLAGQYNPGNSGAILLESGFPSRNQITCLAQVERAANGLTLNQAHRGPRFALGGQTCAPICSFGSTGSKFSMNYLEVHKDTQKNSIFTSMTFKEACQVIYVQTGSMNVEIDGKDHLLHTGDSAYVPPGASFSVQPARKFARCVLVIQYRCLLYTLCKPG